MEDKKQGYVYILTNKAFREDWVKIGKSSRPVDVRSKELDNTAVPLPFDIYATLKTSKFAEVERLVHKTIDRLTDLRIRQNREFFNITPAEALDILRDISMTLEDAVITEYHKEESNCTETTPKRQNNQPRHEKRKAFWAEFISYNKEHDGLYSTNSPVGDNWIGKTLKIPNNPANMNAVIGYDFARVEVYFNAGDKATNKKMFDYLYAKKEELESQYGEELIWERLDDKVTCRIKTEIQVDCFGEDDKTPIYEFLTKGSEKMFDVFHAAILEYINKKK